MGKEKILCVEDDVQLSFIMKRMIENYDYLVTTVHNIAETKAVMEQESFDLILLDMMLPDGEGVKLCSYIRTTSFCPIIFISCLNDRDVKINALKSGGDDYLTKPIDFDELIVRIQSNLRRAKQYNRGRSESMVERYQNILMKKKSKEVFLTDSNGEPLNRLDLSPTEFGLLKEFISHKNELLLYHDLYRLVWDGLEDFGDFRTVMVHVSNLRRKMKQSGSLIHTVRGAGYIFGEREEI